MESPFSGSGPEGCGPSKGSHAEKQAAPRATSGERSTQRFVPFGQLQCIRQDLTQQVSS